MPKGIPLTEEESERRRQEIFDASVHLFVERGFNETSMREIAEAAGVGKSTLYDYFKTKDEILVSFFEREILTMTEQAEKIAREPMSVPEKLSTIMHRHMDYWLERKEFYSRLTVEVQRLSKESQMHLQRVRHDYQDLLCELIEEGKRQGVFQAVDSLVATRLLLLLSTPVVFTTRPTGTPQQMLEQALSIFFDGIRA